MQSPRLSKEEINRYMKQPFEYGAPDAGPFATFYRYSYPLVRSFQFRIVPNYDDYKDVFHDSVYKFCCVMEKNVVKFTRNGNAFHFLSRIFYNTAMDFYNDKKRRDRDQAEYARFNSEKGHRVITDESGELEDIRIIFHAMDLKLIAQPRYLTKAENVFYGFYKSAWLRFSNEKDVKLSIMSDMQIMAGNYATMSCKVRKKLGKNFRSTH